MITHPSPTPSAGLHAMHLYLRDIKDDALLNADEERRLALAIATGDREARARMIQANLRLVVKIARGYARRGMALDDLIGEGNLGLIRAAEDYDPTFGTRFSTYASYWIKQAIRHALTNTTATIRLPAHMIGLLTRWRRTERRLYREAGILPNFDEVADCLGLTHAQRDLVLHARRANALRLEGGSEEAGWTPENSVTPEESPGQALEFAEERRILRERLQRLDDRERTIVILRFGLNGEPPLTLKDVGQRLGVTREWVRKIEIRAVRKLDDDTSVPTPRPNKPFPRVRASSLKPA